MRRYRFLCLTVSCQVCIVCFTVEITLLGEGSECVARFEFNFAQSALFWRYVDRNETNALYDLQLRDLRQTQSFANSRNVGTTMGFWSWITRTIGSVFKAIKQVFAPVVRAVKHAALAAFSALATAGITYMCPVLAPVVPMGFLVSKACTQRAQIELQAAHAAAQSHVEDAAALAAAY